MFSKMFDNINDSESELSVHGFYLTQLVMEHQLFGSLRAALGVLGERRPCLCPCSLIVGAAVITEEGEILSTSEGTSEK